MTGCRGGGPVGTVRFVAARLGAWARLTALGGVWGLGVGWWCGAPASRGLVVGLGLWGSSLFVSLRGPYAPALETLD